MLCKNVEKAETVAEEVRKSGEGGGVVVQKMDLASLKSVKEGCDQLGSSLDKIDVLINNAGVLLFGKTPEMRTEDGFEMQIGTNHFGHFLLTNLLMPLIQKAAPGARIVNVSSSSHEYGQIQWEDMNWERTPYDAGKAYNQSKLANVLFTKELARRVDGSGVNVYAVDPGSVNTDITRHFKDIHGSFKAAVLSLVKPFFKTAQAGAQTQG